jgi:hypothetical protein
MNILVSVLSVSNREPATDRVRYKYSGMGTHFTQLLGMLATTGIVNLFLQVIVFHKKIIMNAIVHIINPS